MEGARTIGHNYHSWTVRLDPTDPEGRDVWEHCAIPNGTPVLLSVQAPLPQMLSTIGFSQSRLPPDARRIQWVNHGIVRVGAWPAPYVPLVKGCNLWVIPSFVEQLITTTTALPEPTDGALDGVDVRQLLGYEQPTLRIWIAVTPGSGDLILPRVWLRHPSGIWSEAQLPITPPPVLVERRAFDISVRNADRVAVSFDFDGLPSGQPVRLAYGCLTAPDPAVIRNQIQIRFGAVPAPSYLLTGDHNA